MSLLTLGEFQRICALSDAALCWLLKHNKLVCSYDNEKGLMIDAESVAITNLIEALRKCRETALLNDEGIRRTMSDLLSGKMSQIISAALERAFANIKGK